MGCHNQETIHRCIKVLQIRPSTADEVADKVNQHVLAIRPVICVLHKKGLIHPTGEKRANKISGKSAHVWALA